MWPGRNVDKQPAAESTSHSSPAVTALSARKLASMCQFQNKRRPGSTSRPDCLHENRER